MPRMTPEHQIWAVALWVEKNHGDHGSAYIAEQIGRLALAGDEAGVTMWKKVAARYSELKQAPPPDRS